MCATIMNVATIVKREVKLREFRATKLTEGIISDVIGGEVVALYAGKIAVRVLMLPASERWAGEIRAEYASNGRPLRVTRGTLSAPLVTEIVTQQADAKWNPLTYGEFIHSGKVRAYLVPDNLAWRARVEGEVSE